MIKVYMLLNKIVLFNFCLLLTAAFIIELDKILLYELSLIFKYVRLINAIILILCGMEYKSIASKHLSHCGNIDESKPNKF